MATAAALALVLAPLVAPADAADPGLEKAQQQEAAAAQRLKEAQTEEDRVADELAVVVRRLGEAEAEEGRTAQLLVEAEARLAAARVRVLQLSDAAQNRIRSAYTSGTGTGLLAVMVSSGDPDDALDRLALLGAVARNDGSVLRDASTAQAAFEQAEKTAADLRQKAAEHRAAVAVEQQRVTQLLGEASKAKATRQAALQEASAEVAAEAQRVAREASARRALLAARGADDGGAGMAVAAQVASRGGYACLVGPDNAFTDTFGAPRSGGRSHAGVDVFAPYGSGAYAVESGVVTRAYSNTLGGLSIYLRGDSGVTYYYAHQSQNIAVSGQRVAVGELIGRVGTSGNASGTAPHVHFEVHPGGGGAVNPTPFAYAVCG